MTLTLNEEERATAVFALLAALDAEIAFRATHETRIIEAGNDEGLIRHLRLIIDQSDTKTERLRDLLLRVSG